MMMIKKIARVVQIIPLLSTTVTKRMNAGTEAALRLVFVYGTLKKGEPNHEWLEKPEKRGVVDGRVRFVGDGVTEVAYPLVIATKYNIPFLLDCPGRGKNVRGEIYEIDDAVLAQLDQLEENPHFYVRRLEPIHRLSSCDVQRCWTYFLPKFKPQLLNLQSFESYSSLGSHGLTYKERYLRDPGWNHRKEVVD